MGDLVNILAVVVQTFCRFSTVKGPMRVQIPTVKPNWLTEQRAESSRDPGYCWRTCTGNSCVGGARQVIHTVGIPRPMDEQALMMSPQKAKLGNSAPSTAHPQLITSSITTS